MPILCLFSCDALSYLFDDREKEKKNENLWNEYLFIGYLFLFLHVVWICPLAIISNHEDLGRLHIFNSFDYHLNFHACQYIFSANL